MNSAETLLAAPITSILRDVGVFSDTEEVDGVIIDEILRNYPNSFGSFDAYDTCSDKFKDSVRVVMLLGFACRYLSECISTFVPKPFGDVDPACEAATTMYPTIKRLFEQSRRFYQDIEEAFEKE
jgi:hypothetical protein